ncbi:MAG: presqualene diphosphate synthase HpnD [Gammaproteobacteria bacterium]|nr:presqualene diphosphate synthase HpnD [Gammaproteobacteria bacterium]
MTPDQYCAQKTAASGSSFSISFRFLPPQRRRAITALYAFCREVDDVVDECKEEAVARKKLDWWREEVTRLYHTQPQHPVTRALAPFIDAFALAEEHFIEIIDGMEMDLDRNRYATFSELSLYCYRAASVVGLLAAAIFGLEDRRTLNYAHDLGMAFQLTNILRDVAEDAARNRIYLPADELARFGVSEAEILQGHDTEALHQLFAFQAARADSFYQKALAELPEVDRYRQLSGLLMAAIYHATLREIVARDYPVMQGRVRLPLWRKLLLVGRTLRQERRRYRRLSSNRSP